MENLAISIFVVDGVVSFVLSSDISVSPSVSLSIKFIPVEADSLTIIPFDEFKASLGSLANTLSDDEINHIRIVMDGVADVIFNKWKKKLLATEIDSPRKNMAV